MIRTRFAPSPTGFMHIGNLRTALFAFLFARHNGGKFVIRIEDTDTKRFVDGATQVIFDTLKTTKLLHDEGPDIGGKFAPYIQSQRKEIYALHAQILLEKGLAYRCFCDGTEAEEDNTFGYNRKCRNLSQEQINDLLAQGKKFVIRQKMPLEGTTTFVDEVYGEITVDNSTLDDQILMKSDGMPTYNFANVVDDHLMQISHVIRGKEYISSTPKYQLLYQAFGWTPPKTIHLSTIMGKNEDGSVSKLSKRHGSVSFANLLQEGYLPEAIINYIALLGWNPKDTKEVFSMEELIQAFNIEGIVKTNAIFDYKKLDWFNAIYISAPPKEDFLRLATPFLSGLSPYAQKHIETALELAQSRISKLSDIVPLFAFLDNFANFDLAMFENKKNKLDKNQSYQILGELAELLQHQTDWTIQSLNALFVDYTTQKGFKLGKTMWPIRIAVTGQSMTPGGAAEMMFLLGKQQSFERINLCLARLKEHLSSQN